MGDVRVMAESAYFGVYCRRWGVPLIDGGTVRLPRLVGLGKALEIIMTGRKVTAEESYRIGLCEKVVPHGKAREAAEAMAQEIARFPQECMRADRLSAYRAWGKSVREGLESEWATSAGIVKAEGIAGAERFAERQGPAWRLHGHLRCPGMLNLLRVVIAHVGLPICLTLLATSVIAQPASGPPPPFVHLSEIAPDILQDMRYASENNFLGRRVKGYDAPECILTRETALALKRVQDALVPKGYALKVYDCYRPERAVRDFVRWSRHEGNASAKQQYYPGLDERDLFKLGYIAARSAHSRGNTVDLTIVRKGGDARALRGQEGVARCGAPDSSLDFGTGFDCFDPKSHTWSTEISARAQRNRRLLVDAMAAEGFHNYSKEWWHFELKGAATPFPFDFPVRKRPDQPNDRAGRRS